MNSILLIIGATSLSLFIWLLIGYRKVANPKWKVPSESFPNDWRTFLINEVNFYNSLSPEDQLRFEVRVQEFLLNCRITGVKTEVSDEDKVLIAASAIIPIFGFENWRYNNIREVLLYPSHFNHNFQFGDEHSEKNILGMVGSHYMEGLMILSKDALYHGFSNETDKRNTAVHEFVHLIDKSDGVIDGIPATFLDHQYILPWVQLMEREMKSIRNRTSDIDSYGATERAEFLTVISEYFFEKPKLLEKRHPELYVLLEKIFNQDMAERNLKNRKSRIGRNDPCVCGSGEKFKKCCGRSHF